MKSYLSMDWQKDVLSFTKAVGHAIGKYPRRPRENVRTFRRELLTKEFEELLTSLESRDPAQVADASIDLIYVILGTSIAWGIDLRPIWGVVHESNMQKISKGNKPLEQVKKPEGWKHANLKPILAKQGQLV